MIPAVPNQVWIILTQSPPLLTASDESRPGESQVPPPGHQASQLEPRPGQRGGQGRGEAAQKRWDHDSENDNDDDNDVSLLCQPRGLPPEPPVSVQPPPADPRDARVRVRQCNARWTYPEPLLWYSDVLKLWRRMSHHMKCLPALKHRVKLMTRYRHFL